MTRIPKKQYYKIIKDFVVSKEIQHNFTSRDFKGTEFQHNIGSVLRKLYLNGYITKIGDLQVGYISINKYSI